MSVEIDGGSIASVQLHESDVAPKRSRVERTEPSARLLAHEATTDPIVRAVLEKVGPVIELDPHRNLREMRNAFRAFLTQRKVTQRQVATHLKMHESQLSRMFSEPPGPDYDEMNRLLEAVEAVASKPRSVRRR